jgi:hypothetical protein
MNISFCSLTAEIGRRFFNAFARTDSDNAGSPLIKATASESADRPAENRSATVDHSLPIPID